LPALKKATLLSSVASFIYRLFLCGPRCRLFFREIVERGSRQAPAG